MQLVRMAMHWDQGQHVLVSGGTGSGKTRLARELIDIRVRHGGHVVVFFGKLRPDDTITNFYGDFKRWTEWHRRPHITENKILLYPKVEGLDLEDAVREMHRVFNDALRHIGKTGDWTVLIDDGLFVTSPHFLDLSHIVAMMHMLIRSSHGTLLSLIQRPSHFPVTVYPNISEAFVGRASERSDVQRLAELAGKENSFDLMQRIRQNGTHDFTWITVGRNYSPEQINLAR